LPTTDVKSRFYLQLRLSGKMGLTKGGFLLCEDVPIARTGAMVYGPGETNIETGNQGYALVECEPEELFKPETIASFNGVPFLDEHPDNEDAGVDPENWQEYARGVVLNPRRGGPGHENELLADILITVQDVIDKVMDDDKREVSCGYDADYEQTAVGKGRKFNIVGNHVALVGDGRCGKKCGIQDHLPGRVKEIMKRKSVDSMLKKFKDAIKAGDSAAAAKIADEEIGPALTEGAEPDPVMDEAGGTHTHVHIHGKDAAPEEPGELAQRVKFTDDELEKRFTGIDSALTEIKGRLPNPAENGSAARDAAPTENADGYMCAKGTDAAPGGGDKDIEGALEEEAPEGTGDKARKATDSQYLQESFDDTVALAEILAPGVKLPTFDRAMKPQMTYDNICRLRKKALSQALGAEDTSAIITDLRGGRETTPDVIKKLTCDSARTLFIAAANQKRQTNNAGHRQVETRRTADAAPGVPTSIAEMNKRNREFYATK
jgi:hypothetical protein